MIYLCRLKKNEFFRIHFLLFHHITEFINELIKRIECFMKLFSVDDKIIEYDLQHKVSDKIIFIFWKRLKCDRKCVISLSDFHIYSTLHRWLDSIHFANRKWSVFSYIFINRKRIFDISVIIFHIVHIIVKSTCFIGGFL